MKRSVAKANRVLEIVGEGHVALWRGHQVRSIDGALHYFPAERDARLFLSLCDAVKGVPAIAVAVASA